MLEAADGEEALEIVRMPMASIDLLLLDVVLPDMDGIRLYVEISARRPGIPAPSCRPIPLRSSPPMARRTLQQLSSGNRSRAKSSLKVGEAIERRSIPRNLTEREVPFSREEH